MRLRAIAILGFSLLCANTLVAETTRLHNQQQDETKMQQKVQPTNDRKHF